MTTHEDKNKLQKQLIQALRAEFNLRCQKNPNYSLRSYGKSLGISHTILSLVFSGKRPLSRRSALIVCHKLGLPPEFQTALASQKSPTTEARTEYELIELETFHVISDWVHYAILSLLEIKRENVNAKWIAKRLNINEAHAQICFQRLQDLGFIEQVKGRWRQTKKPIKVENKISTASTRKFQRQLLEKAIESLENDPMDIRDFSSMTLAMDPKHVSFAKERIRKFRRELTEELEAKGPAREVYNLTVQIYPVSKQETP